MSQYDNYRHECIHPTNLGSKGGLLVLVYLLGYVYNIRKYTYHY